MLCIHLCIEISHEYGRNTENSTSIASEVDEAVMCVHTGGTRLNKKRPAPATVFGRFTPYLDDITTFGQGSELSMLYSSFVC